MRRGLFTCMMLLAFAPAALAQAPEDELDDEPVPEATATPAGCEDRGPGTDGDYAYCADPCVDESTDADYAYQVYCLASPTRGVPPKRRPRPRAAVQPLPAQTLPMTGDETWLIAAIGAGFLLTGSGLRLRARS